LERGISSYRVDREGYHLTLEDLPSWVCQQCGLAVYDDDQSDTIEQVIQTLDAAAQRLRHPARA
jgi:YgiT-type zinc finger domain-containing protein